jgi:hypothetical protein
MTQCRRAEQYSTVQSRAEQSRAGLPNSPQVAGSVSGSQHLSQSLWAVSCTAVTSLPSPPFPSPQALVSGSTVHLSPAVPRKPQTESHPICLPACLLSFLKLLSPATVVPYSPVSTNACQSCSSTVPFVYKLTPLRLLTRSHSPTVPHQEFAQSLSGGYRVSGLPPPSGPLAVDRRRGPHTHQ